MGLRLYNTLTRTKQDFVPIDPGNVRMYVCGPTVYDFAHIGNARPLIVFDVLYRLLRHLYPGEGGAPDGSRVTYVRNITDVDDKINARAARDYPDLPLNEAIREVTSRTEAQFHADVAALGCLPPTVEPRATEFISKPDAPTDMIRLIGELIDRGHAYAAEGHVLFDVGSMPDYGKLSNRSLDDMVAGARVEVAPYKKDPMDFVLWKPSKPGEPAWDSPWGRGRPGWHLECSAMAGALLGDVFDIHGGGIDLVFPHHENEIAQSRCAHGTDVMANYWLHNGFLQVEGEKMAKSAGNFVTIRELLETETFGGRRWPGEVLRLAMLMTHYREPVDFSVSRLKEASTVRYDWMRVAKMGRPERGKVSASVVSALSEDLDFNAVRLAIDELIFRATASDFEHMAHRDARDELAATLLWLGLASDDDFKSARDRDADVDDAMERVVVGLANKYASTDVSIADLKNLRERTDPAQLNLAIEQRLAFIRDKDWAQADRIRDEIDAKGVALKDAKDPETGERVTTWEVKR